MKAVPPCPQPQPEAAERITRHLRLCRELIELGMTLARAAADRAIDDIAAPPPVAAIPGSSAAAIAQAQDEARRRAPDYGKLFTHLSRAVRQTMLLETHLADGQPTAPVRISQHGPALNTPATPQPDHDTLRRDTVERLDCALAAHANGQIPVDDLLLAISQQFGLGSGPAPQPEHPPSSTTDVSGPTRPHRSNPAPHTECGASPPEATSRSDRRGPRPATAGGPPDLRRSSRPPDT